MSDEGKAANTKTTKATRATKNQKKGFEDYQTQPLNH